MCGEKLLYSLTSSLVAGSPPHVRGKVRLDRGGKGGLWITPACAGKRRLRHPKTAPFRDHPRICGEKMMSPARSQGCMGSPPHVRGKVSCMTYGGGHTGITPACAGKSVMLSYPMSGDADHPRMCGEKLLRQELMPKLRGSPPHVRGKVTLQIAQGDGQRITPACAGKSYRGTVFLA